jgi:hypothetical protein
MALRSQKAIGVVIAGLFFALTGYGQPLWTADVIHDHWKGECRGPMVVTENGVTFKESAQKRKPEELHEWTWPDDEIQQLTVTRDEITILTYSDRSWVRLGTDRSYRFRVGSDRTTDLSAALRPRLQTRLVVAFAETINDEVWEVSVKRLAAIKGAEGRLVVGRERIVFDSTKKSASRTWTYDDIENVSTTGPFELTVTTQERDRSQYGSIRAFTFQLKRPMTARQYDDLWYAINQKKGLKTLLRESDQGRP